MIYEHFAPLLIAVPLFGAFLTPIIGRLGKRSRDTFVLIVLILTSLVAFFLIQEVHSKGIVVYTFGSKIPSIAHPSSINIPVRIVFEIDGLSVFMIIVSIVLVFFAIIYSLSFFKNDKGLDRFYTLLLLLLVGILGLELTGDMFNFFVFMEISSISASALIAFSAGKGESLEAGIKYLTVSSIGALFLLFAIAILYSQYDALNMAKIASSITGTYIDKIAFILIISALAFKSGIAPMHMWMPDAYGAAQPSVTVSIIAATQASMYGLIRIAFLIFKPSMNISMVSAVLITLAVTSILIGATMTLIQSRLTRAIAYAAVAEMGYILLGIGVALYQGISGSGEVALKGGIFHIFNDALDMGLLFLTAGAVIYVTKEVDMNKLGGLARKMKYTTTFFLIGLFAASGMPPMNGFASKLMIYESVYALNPILSIVAILSSILMLAIFVRIFYSVFLGPELPSIKDVKEVPLSMIVSMACISIFIIIFGLFPDYIVNILVNPAVSSLSNYTGYVKAILGGGV